VTVTLLVQVRRDDRVDVRQSLLPRWRNFLLISFVSRMASRFFFKNL
jgi:hypothetical protein